MPARGPWGLGAVLARMACSPRMNFIAAESSNRHPFRVPSVVTADALSRRSAPSAVAQPTLHATEVQVPPGRLTSITYLLRALPLNCG
eukprot:856579-Amphidinium_carterae.1